MIIKQKQYLRAQFQELIIHQSGIDQSVLINGGKFNNLEIFFKGIKSNYDDSQNGQRFNKRGLTGCLNIYNATFNDTSIFVDGGQCEDSLNIVLSKGHLNKVNVLNSPQDAIDFDFSEISIDNILVKNAGNDCLDVSSENTILKSNLDNCDDKYISVEKSNLMQIM